MTTNQSLLILVAGLPSSTFALRLIGHSSEQTSLTNYIFQCSTLWPGQLTVQTCIQIFPVSSNGHFSKLLLSLLSLPISYSLILLYTKIWLCANKRYLSLNYIFTWEGLNQVLRTLISFWACHVLTLPFIFHCDL